MDLTGKKMTSPKNHGGFRNDVIKRSNVCLPQN
jgi:hypothetical protein